VDNFLLSAGVLHSVVDTSACVCVASTAALRDGCFCVIDASVLLNNVAVGLPSISADFT